MAKIKRPIKVCGNIAYVYLTKGYVATIDADQAEKVGRYNWCACDGGRGKIYAKRLHNGNTIRLHRFLMNAPKDMTIDHIDGNPLNNRISNLRITTQANNNINARKRSSKSGLKGAYWHKHRGKWQSSIGTAKGSVYLGLFDTAEEAHAAYCKASEKYHREFGRID